MIEKIKQYPVASFFIITLLWSFLVWACLLPSVSSLFGFHAPGWVFWLGEIAPGGTALLLTSLLGGEKKLVDLLRPIFIWKVSPLYYCIVIIASAFFYLAATGLSALIGEHVPMFSALYIKISDSFAHIPAIWLLPILSIIYLFCEELGWRGFALRKLLTKYDVFTASIVIGFFWALFHVPLMLENVHKINLSYILIYFGTTILDSFLFTWIYVKTNKSLLLVSLLHGATNLYGAFSPTIISIVGQGENLRTAILRLIILAPVVLWAFSLRKKTEYLQEERV